MSEKQDTAEKSRRSFRHTVETVADALKSKCIDGYVTVQALDHDRNSVTVLDKDFGSYSVDLKSLCPRSQFPLHLLRRRKNRLDALKAKHVGTTVAGLKITGVFYGPDEGYRNRGFYLRCVCDAGHEAVFTYASLTKHKKYTGCAVCTNSRIIHGERTRVDGALSKRTSTYTYWVSHNKSFPEEYREFTRFKEHAGEKPSKKAKIEFIDGRPIWIDLSLSEDNETHLIAAAMRQAFRHSRLYKQTLAKAKVETATATKYRCAACGELFSQGQVQVDHIDPIEPLDGSPLLRSELISRIWTDRIQILDRRCHTKKSSQENKIRRDNRKRRLLQK